MALRAHPRPVTRLNRRTLAILAGGLSVGVMGALIWSLQPQQRGAGESTELYNVDRVSSRKGWMRCRRITQSCQRCRQMCRSWGHRCRVIWGQPSSIRNSRSPLPMPRPATTPTMRCARRKRLQLRRVFFRTGSPQAAPVAQSQVAAAPGFAADAAFDPLAGGPASTAAQPADPTAVQNRQDQKAAFLAGGSTETRNSGNLQMPTSPYQVMAGTVIAGALVTGIKSDLPGDVIATVTEPIYDTATGKFLLIRRGRASWASTTARSAMGRAACRWCRTASSCPIRLHFTLDNLVGCSIQQAMPVWKTMWTGIGIGSLQVPS